MEKSIINELSSQIHQLEKENIPKDELLNILKNYVEKERKLMEIIFTDGNESYNGAYFDYYYDLKFGGKSLQLLPDLYEAVFVKVKDRYGDIVQYYGCFERDEEHELYFSLKRKLRYIGYETITRIYNIINIIEWNYADKNLICNFNNIFGNFKTFDINNYDLNVRFINIYEKYVNIGVVTNTEEKWYVNHEIKAKTDLDAFKYLYINSDNNQKKEARGYSMYLINGVLYHPDFYYKCLYNRRLPKLTEYEINEKINQSKLKEEDVIKLEENFEKYYNKKHVDIFKIDEND